MNELERQSPAAPRFQFSLRTALLMVAFAAVGFSLWVSFGQWRENRRLRAELIRMKDRVGELEIAPGEEHKVHAVAMPTLESMTWKWSVYIPEGREYWLKSDTMLDAKSWSGGPIPAGRYTITVSPRRDHLNQWKLFVAIEGGSSQWSGSKVVQKGIPEELAKLLEEGCEASSSGVSGNAVAEPGKDLELLRRRMEPSLKGMPVCADFLQGKHPGILVWITEQKR